MAVRRLRDRFTELIDSELGDTVLNTEELRSSDSTPACAAPDPGVNTTPPDSRSTIVDPGVSWWLDPALAKLAFGSRPRRAPGAGATGVPIAPGLPAAGEPRDRPGRSAVSAVSAITSCWN
jgi:hypothetical protein